MELLIDFNMDTVVYVLNHVKQHNKVYLENKSERLLLSQPARITGCFSFFPSTWHYIF